MRGFQTFNPQQNSFNPTVYKVSSPEEVENAIQLADETFDVWNESSALERAKLLLEIKAELLTEKKAICSLYCAESGLNKQRFEIEFQRTIFQLELFSDFLTNTFSKIVHSAEANTEKNLSHLQKTTQAIGTVLVIGSSNFPLAYSTIGGDSVAALSAGCPVIVKAHPMHVGTSSLVATCVQKAIKNLAFHPGIFSHLIDDSYEISTQLIQHSSIKAVGFTGSIKGGRALMDLASSRPDPIPVFAEMGSSNPVVVLESAFDTTENWSTIFAQSVTNDAGQFCTKPGLFFVPNSEKGKQFAEELVEKIRTSTPYHMLHPNIESNFENRKQEVRQVEGVAFFESELAFSPNQGKIAVASCDLDVFKNNSILHEEVFGPFALVIFYENQEELKQTLQLLHGQLTFSILTSILDSSLETFVRIARKKAGRIILNGVPTGVRVDAAQNHGGPYPASSDSRFTAVGTDSIYRFLRNVSLQNFVF